jgi:murein DD-endopeptidase MepM/ murein hydrolase activator NlpD
MMIVAALGLFSSVPSGLPRRGSSVAAASLLAQRNKEEGEMVGEGELIGYLGQPESATNPRLYFEIRKGGLNLDPLKWVKVR